MEKIKDDINIDSEFKNIKRSRSWKNSQQANKQKKQRSKPINTAMCPNQKYICRAVS